MIRNPERAAVLGAMALTIALVGCTDFDTIADPAFGLPDVIVADPTFATEIQPIFDRRCSIGGCHSLATAQGGLSLHQSVSYASLVGVEARTRPGFVRVVAFDAPRSWLIRMIGPDDVAREGHPRMPLASTPLTPNQIATIENWIEQGARPD
jgi:hypothetical protein